MCFGGNHPNRSVSMIPLGFTSAPYRLQEDRKFMVVLFSGDEHKRVLELFDRNGEPVRLAGVESRKYAGEFDSLEIAQVAYEKALLNLNLSAAGEILTSVLAIVTTVRSLQVLVATEDAFPERKEPATIEMTVLSITEQTTDTNHEPTGLAGNIQNFEAERTVEADHPEEPKSGGGEPDGNGPGPDQVDPSDHQGHQGGTS